MSALLRIHVPADGSRRLSLSRLGQSGAVDREPTILHGNPHGLSIFDRPGQQQVGKWILQFPLNDALERARAIDRVVAGISEPSFCRFVDLKRDLAVVEQPLEML